MVSISVPEILYTILLILFKACIVVSRTSAPDCHAILYGPIINGQEWSGNVIALEGNETSPVNLTCSVECLNTSYSHHPAIALVAPQMHDFFESIQRSLDYDRRDGLYQRIDYRPPSRLCVEASDNTMEYSFEIYPKIKMNWATLRCGVTQLIENGQSCWGQQLVLVRYVTSLTTDTDPTPTTSSSNGSTTTDGTIIFTFLPHANPSIANQRNTFAGLFAVAMTTTIVLIVAVVSVMLGCKWYINRSTQRRVASRPASPDDALESRTPPQEMMPTNHVCVQLGAV